jgi:hypothetical protein
MTTPARRNAHTAISLVAVLVTAALLSSCVAFPPQQVAPATVDQPEPTARTTGTEAADALQPIHDHETIPDEPSERFFEIAWEEEAPIPKAYGINCVWPAHMRALRERERDQRTWSILVTEPLFGDDSAWSLLLPTSVEMYVESSWSFHIDAD